MKNIIYHLSETLYLLKHKKLSTLLMVLSMTIMLSLLCVVISGSLITEYVMVALRNEAEIDVYLKDDAFISMSRKIEAMNEGITTKTVSADEVYTRMNELLGADQSVLTFFDENPFVPYIEVKVPIEDSDRIVSQISSLNGVDYVRDNKDVIDQIDKLSGVLKTASSLILAGVAIGTFFILTGTIRQGVYQYQDKIQTMELLGAQKSFIVAPFYIEGIGLSVISALIAYQINRFIFTGVYINASATIPFVPLPPVSDILSATLVFIILFSSVLGGIGSYFGLKTSSN